MPLYADVRELVETTVLGVKDADGAVDLRLSAACRDGYEKSLFLCPKLADIKGLATQIREKVRSHELVPSSDIPGSISLLQAQEGQDALSLSTLTAIQLAMKALCENSERIPALVGLAQSLRRHFDHPDILPPGSIIPAFFSPNPEFIREIREKYASPEIDALTFSGRVMKDALGDKLAERMFLERLEKGYEGNHFKNGHFKLTEKTARVLYERLRNLAGEDEFPDFETFAPPAPLSGPRRGQVSKALRVSWGNLV